MIGVSKFEPSFLISMTEQAPLGENMDTSTTTVNTALASNSPGNMASLVVENRLNHVAVQTEQVLYMSESLPPSMMIFPDTADATMLSDHTNARYEELRMAAQILSERAKQNYQERVSDYENKVAQVTDEYNREVARNRVSELEKNALKTARANFNQTIHSQFMDMIEKLDAEFDGNLSEYLDMLGFSRQFYIDRNDVPILAIHNRPIQDNKSHIVIVLKNHADINANSGDAFEKLGAHLKQGIRSDDDTVKQACRYCIEHKSEAFTVMKTKLYSS